MFGSGRYPVVISSSTLGGTVGISIGQAIFSSVGVYSVSFDARPNRLRFADHTQKDLDDPKFIDRHLPRRAQPECAQTQGHCCGCSFEDLFRRLLTLDL